MIEPTNSSNQKRPIRRRILIFMLLVLILIGINLVYPLAANWQPILSGEPGELLYVAAFDGFMDEWQQYEGRTSAQIADGVMRIGVETSATIYSAAAPTFKDFDASVIVSVVDGSLQNEGVGLVFRLQESSSVCDRAFILACGLADMPLLGTPIRLLFPHKNTGATGFYVFLISDDGYYAIWRSNENNQLEKATVWHYSDGLIHEGLNVENTIRVVGNGSQFSFYINDQQVELCIPHAGEQPTGNAINCLGDRQMIWTDSTLKTGKLGLVVNTNQFPGTIAEFDDFTVISPDHAGDQL